MLGHVVHGGVVVVAVPVRNVRVESLVEVAVVGVELDGRVLIPADDVLPKLGQVAAHDNFCLDIRIDPIFKNLISL